MKKKYIIGMIAIVVAFALNLNYANKGYGYGTLHADIIETTEFLQMWGKGKQNLQNKTVRGKLYENHITLYINPITKA